MNAVLVVLGALVGAPLRYLTDRAVQRRHGNALPLGTLTVNLAGSLVLGALAGAGPGLPSAVAALVGTGFCGTLTTYSTFGYETIRLLENRSYRAAVLNLVLSVVAGITIAMIGYLIGDALVRTG